MDTVIELDNGPFQKDRFLYDRVIFPLNYGSGRVDCVILMWLFLDSETGTDSLMVLHSF